MWQSGVRVGWWRVKLRPEEHPLQLTGLVLGLKLVF